MKHVSMGAMLITAGVLFTIIVGQRVWYTQRLTQTIAQSSGAVKYNCDLSDGVYQDGRCECPHAPEIGQTSDGMYDHDTGFCQTEYGGAGGDAFLAQSGLPYGDYFYFLEVVANNCKKSGGSFMYGYCTCQRGKTYSKSTGLCE